MEPRAGCGSPGIAQGPVALSYEHPVAGELGGARRAWKERWQRHVALPRRVLAAGLVRHERVRPTHSAWALSAWQVLTLQTAQLPAGPQHATRAYCIKLTDQLLDRENSGHKTAPRLRRFRESTLTDQEARAVSRRHRAAGSPAA